MARPRRILAPRNELLEKWLERWRKVASPNSDQEQATLAIFALREHAGVLSKQPPAPRVTLQNGALTAAEALAFRQDMLSCQNTHLTQVFFLSALYEALRFPSAKKNHKRQSDSYFTPAFWAGNFVGYLKKEELALEGETFLVLEPCAGSGNLLFAFLDWVSSNSPELLPRLKFIAFEKDFFHHQALKILWPLALEEISSRLKPAQEETLPEKPETLFLQTDFFKEAQAFPCADLILFNPPWSTTRPNIRRRARQKNPALADLAREKLPPLPRSQEQSPSYGEFLQAALAKLKPGGLLSAILPAGFLADKGMSSLRRQLLDQGTWLRTYVFNNKQTYFPMHADLEFLFLYFRARGKTSALSLFSETGTHPQAICLERNFLEKLSSRFLVVPSSLKEENRSLLEKMLASDSRLFALEKRGGGAFTYQREFDLSQMSALAPGKKVRTDGQPPGDKFLPVLEGRMLQAYDCKAKQWVQGWGRGAIWKKGEGNNHDALACHSIPESLYRKRVPAPCIKVAYVAVSGRRNRRMMKAALTPDLPHGSSVPVFALPLEETEARKKALLLVALLNSSAFDFFLRATLAGNNLNYYWLSQVPIPRAFLPENFCHTPSGLLHYLSELAEQLTYTNKQLYLEGKVDCHQNEKPLKNQDCFFLADLIVAKLYGFSWSEYEPLLKDSLNRGFFDAPPEEKITRERENQNWLGAAKSLYAHDFSLSSRAPRA